MANSFFMHYILYQKLTEFIIMFEFAMFSNS